VLRQHKPPPKHLTPNISDPGLEPDFQINLDICQIAPKILQYITLSPSVILPSTVKISRWLYEKC